MTGHGTHISLTAADSRSAPAVPPFREGAPNVVVVILDDLGFAQLGCFGSSIDTPNFDRVAARGVRFTNFHTTALCSPTRACLLTGRNHHRVGLGFLPDVPMRFPGYHGRIPRTAATLPAVLGEQGYATYMVGKWHLVPRDERTPAGPHAHWPLGLGFDRFYGFLGGDTNQWTPDLVEDNTYVPPPCRPEDGYHLNADLADRAIAYLDELRWHHPDRPFLLYYSTGAMHAPHQVERDWADRYAGRFDHGWDAERERVLARQRSMGVVPDHAELSERPRWVPAWASLRPDEQRVAARMMEVFAGFLSQTDHHFGRVLDHIEALGELDDTIVVVCSDNGASGEGGPEGSVNELRFIEELHEDHALNLAMIDELGGWKTYGHYPWGWAMAGNTPLRRWKRYTLEGGIRDPLVVSFPAGSDSSALGSVRDQYCHVVDVFPTVLECCGVEMPASVRGVEQMPVDGVSLAAFLGPGGATAPAVRTTQYYEMWGSRAIYHDGWKAATNHVNQQHRLERELTEGSADFETDEWSLFSLDDDFSESHDVAAAHPERLRALVELWHSEAARNDVLPLSDHVVDRFAHLDAPYMSVRSSYVLAPGARLHEEAGPMLVGSDYTLTAELGAGLHGDATGILCEQGNWTNGFAWYLLAGELVWVLNYVGESLHFVRAPIPIGATSVSFSYTRREGGPALGRLFADGRELVATDVEAPMPFRWNPNGAFLTVGSATGFPVCDEYHPPFACTADLARLAVVVGDGEPPDIARLLEQLIHHD